MNRGNQIERNAALLRGVLELERTITASEQARIYADIKARAVAALEYELRADEEWAKALIDDLFDQAFQQGMLAGLQFTRSPI